MSADGTVSAHREWAIDYHDGYGPQMVPNEHAGRVWVEHWNAHREGATEAATLIWRWVKRTPWTVRLTSPEDPALRDGYPTTPTHTPPRTEPDDERTQS